MEVDLSGEKRLLAAVVGQALMEVKAVTPKLIRMARHGKEDGYSSWWVGVCEERLHQGENALGWLLSGNGGRKSKRLRFEEICSYLNLDPEPFRKKALLVISENKVRRAA